MIASANAMIALQNATIKSTFGGVERPPDICTKIHSRWTRNSLISYPEAERLQYFSMVMLVMVTRWRVAVS